MKSLSTFSNTNRIFALVVFVILFRPTICLAINGNGTEIDPYRIESFEDFQEFASDPAYWASGVHTRLETNIDLNPTLAGRQAYTTAVISPDTSSAMYFQGTAFTGIFDGKGHEILNLTIDTAGSNNSWLGFFGQFEGSGAEIKNLIINNVEVIGGYDSVLLGGLCGRNMGVISNCYTSGEVYGGSQSHYIGGLCGDSQGSVSNSYSTCAVAGRGILGGLCGDNNGGTINDCYAMGTVTGISNSGYLGGLCGRNMGVISNCYATGLLTNGVLIGGICGWNNSTISSSFWDIWTSGMYTSAGGMGLTTSQMKQQASFTGWDFVSTWDIVENQSYPFLRPYIDADPPSDPPEPEIPDNSLVINPLPNENKLVVLIHGWQPSWFGFNSAPQIEELWSSKMADELDAMKDNEQLDSSWKVVVWDWIDEAYVYRPGIAKTKALEQGDLLAENIIQARSDWQHVHLIAHSAGFWVNKTASEKLLDSREQGIFTGSLHLTSLDAYTTFTPSDVSYEYGSGLDFTRDWADNYYAYGLGDLGDLFSGYSTAGRLKNAHNEDLSLTSGFMGGHGYLPAWYHATINQPLGDDNLFNGAYYGFPRGLEAGESSWVDSLDIPVGNSPPTLIDKTKSVAKGVVDYTKSVIVKSATGAVKAASNILSLITGSPVWTHVLLEMPDNSNYISFTYQFDDIGEGYLTAYFNENLILIGDQRFDSNDTIESGKIYVGDLLQDDNWLTLRLDSIDGGQSEISLSDIEMGTITNQADITNDLIVNLDDFASFAGQWLSSDCDEQNEWCEECDFDQSGAVGVNDLEVVTTNWLWKPVERVKSDINLTGKVDLPDFSIFASQWMTGCQGPDWCYGCDFDKSGKVELIDLVEFAGNWLVEY